MKIDGKPYRSLWLDRDGRTARIIDQRWLPHELWVVGLNTLDEAVDAIRDGRVRGGPLTAAVCAYGVAFAMLEDPSTTSLMRACGILGQCSAASTEARWALREMSKSLLFRKPWERREAAYLRARQLCEADVVNHQRIAGYGLDILREIRAQKNGRRLNVLVPSSAGWLSAVDWGTALAPVYHGREAGVAVHVWLDASGGNWMNTALTRWELAGQGIPHTTINLECGPDVMRNGFVDIVLLSAQNVSAEGNVRNTDSLSRWAKMARGAGIPCYAAATSAAIGAPGTQDDLGLPMVSDLAPDVTVSEHLTGLITERGVCRAAPDDLNSLFPDRLQAA